MKFSVMLSFLVSLICLSLVVASREGCGDVSEKKLTIVSYNDVYVMEQVKSSGRFLGGASRAAYITKSMHKKDPETLVLFSGDTMSPSLWSSIFKGIQMVDAHNVMECDFASLGNHEFDFGLDSFHNVSKRSNFPWLNANCFENDSKDLLRGTQPNAIKEVNGIKVGLFGVMYDMNRTNLGVYFTDPIEAGKKQVEILKEQGAEFIIALTHQGYLDDNKFSEQVEGVDLILGGHDHKAMMQTDFGTPYIKSDMDFKNIWVTEASYVEDETPYFSMKFENIPLSIQTPTDDEMDALIEEYKKKVAPEFDVVFGQACIDIDIRQETVRKRECPIGNFITDSLRTAYSNAMTDFAVMNGGGIRTDKVQEKGDVTRGDVVSWLPFGNILLVAEQFSGAAVKKMLTAMLEETCGASGTQEQNGQFPHVSGMKFVYKCLAQGQGEIVSVKQVLDLGDEVDVDDEKMYSIAVNDYSYKKFSDAFEGTKLIVSELDANSLDAIVLKSVKKNGFCPEIEGRITIEFE